MKTHDPILAALLALALTGCARQAEPAPDGIPVTLRGGTLVFNRPASGEPREQEKSLTVAKVTRLRTRVTHYPGRLVWNEDRTVRISSPFAGRVIRIEAQIGDRVTAGAPLLVLASPDIGAAQADSARAGADLALAEKTLRRARDLQAAGVVAARDVEQAEADLAHAVAEHDRARHRLEPYGGGAAVSGQYVVRSPIAGVVVERAANPGQEVRPDQAAPLFVVSDPATLWLQIDLPEDSLSATHVGQEVTVRRGRGDAVRTARVVSVADAVDAMTRTLHTRAVLGNADRVLKAEQFVDVEVHGTAEPVAAVPAEAVFLVGDRQFVWVADGHGAYTRREVQPDGESDGEVAIPSGVGPDELVVTRGAIFLQQFATNAASE